MCVPSVREKIKKLSYRYHITDKILRGLWMYRQSLTISLPCVKDDKKMVTYNIKICGTIHKINQAL